MIRIRSRFRTSSTCDNETKSTHQLELDVNDMVFAREYRPGARWVEAVVLERQGAVNYKVDIGTGHWIRHVNQLKIRAHTRDMGFYNRDGHSSPSTELRGWYAGTP